MPRSMWKGVVSFGMVSIPIRLYNATESSAKVSFRQLCPEHRSPISYKRWCADGDHEVSYGEILRGYEIGKDRYVIIEDKDLDNLPLPTAHSIDISEFVGADEIEAGLYFDNAYYVEPAYGEFFGRAEILRYIVEVMCVTPVRPHTACGRDRPR